MMWMMVATPEAPSGFLLVVVVMLSLAYLMSDVWRMWSDTKGVSKNRFRRSAVEEGDDHQGPTNTVIYHPVPKNEADLGRLHVQWISNPFSILECAWYLLVITLNFQLNNLWRLLELSWRWPSAANNVALSHSDVYAVIMDSTLHMWIRTSSGEPLQFDNVMLPVGRNWWFGGTSAKIFDTIKLELDHESCETVVLSMRSGTDVQYSTDPMEMAAVVAAVSGCYVHGQAHLIGAEVRHVNMWPLSRKAGVAMNGLNFAVGEDWATRNLLIGPEGREILQHNLLLGTPHFAKGCEPRCLGRSGLFQTVKAAHGHPVFQKYCKNPFELSALSTCQVLHPVDHYVIGTRIPRFLDSKLLDSNFTFLRIFAAEVNRDFTANFAEPWDEVGVAALELLKVHAPHLAAGYRAIPNN
jgi:hypothetical protein